jgi:hypothetical protein
MGTTFKEREMFENLFNGPKPKPVLKLVERRTGMDRREIPATKDYTVVVSNIGNVYKGPWAFRALAMYQDYVELSRVGYGRCAGEDVTLWFDGEPTQEFIGRRTASMLEQVPA